MKKIFSSVMMMTILALAAGGLNANGTDNGTIISNARTVGSTPSYTTATNAGDLAATFTNSASSVFNGTVTGTVATTLVSPGYDISTLLFTNASLTNGFAAAGSYVLFGGFVTNWGNLTDTLSFQITNRGATAGWLGAYYSLYINGALAQGPAADIIYSMPGVIEGQVVRYGIRVDVPVAMGNGSSNALRFWVNDSVPAGDAWPVLGAIFPATADTANIRDRQSRYLLCKVSGPVLQISKEALTPNARPYELVTYRIHYTNAGSATALGVTIRDTIPSNVTNITNLRAAYNGGATNAIIAPAGVISGNRVIFKPNAATVNVGDFGYLFFTVRVK